jgi:hypothetical protein
MASLSSLRREVVEYKLPSGVLGDMTLIGTYSLPNAPPTTPIQPQALNIGCLYQQRERMMTGAEHRLFKSINLLIKKQAAANCFTYNGELNPKVRKQFDSIIKQAQALPPLGK